MQTYNKFRNTIEAKPNEKNVTTVASGRKHAVIASAFVVLFAATIIVTLVALATNKSSKAPWIDNSSPVGTEAIVFRVPVANYTSMLKDCSLSALQYNETMKRWESHKMVDLAAPLGSPVLATYSGTVTSVKDHQMYGRQVTIQHRDGLATVYSNLDRNTLVSEGQQIAAGHQIGSVGQTGCVEFVTTPHVRVEVYKNGKRVDPNDFIDFPTK